MKSLILTIALLLALNVNLFAQDDKPVNKNKYEPGTLLNKAQTKAYVGGLCFIAGSFSWVANQFEFFGRERNTIRAYNVAGMALMSTGIVFEALAIDNLIESQRGRNVSLKVSPVGFSLAMKF